jgi:hypothetical protein
MRKGYVAILVALMGAGTLGQSRGVAAQEVDALPAVQMIGPLYAYGPDLLPPPRYSPGYGSHDRPYYRLRPSAPRYGDRRSRSGAGSGYGQGSRYADRYGYARPYRYARPRGPQEAYQDLYAARIITPRMSGRWRDLGPIFQMRTY